MYQIDFHKPQAVHFIGIGGISMSGLAEILMDEGFSVTGSDSHESELTHHLEAKRRKNCVRTARREYYRRNRCGGLYGCGTF